MKPTRIPRLRGLTDDMISYHQETNPQNQKQRKKSIKTKILNHYIQNQLTYCNKELSLQELANFIQIPLFRVLDKVYAKGLNKLSGIDNVIGLQKMSSVILGKAIWEVTRDRQLIENQVDMLIKSQGNRYVPFLSDTLNRAIGFMQNSTKNSLELYNSIAKNSASTLQVLTIQNNFLKANQSSESFTQLQAIELLESKALPLHEKGQELEKSYASDNLPNILASEVQSSKAKALPYKLLQNEIDNAVEVEVE